MWWGGAGAPAWWCCFSNDTRQLVNSSTNHKIKPFKKISFSEKESRIGSLFALERTGKCQIPKENFHFIKLQKLER